MRRLLVIWLLAIAAALGWFLRGDSGTAVVQEQLLLADGLPIDRISEVEIEYRDGRTMKLEREGDRWTTARVKTTSPLTIHLDTYDVRPRKGFGVLAAKTLEAMAPKVAKEVQISVVFSAKVDAPRVAGRGDASTDAPADGPSPAG